MTELPYDLTVVITSYNRRELLRRCLDSLAVQTLDDSRFEVIVLDDGSTDGTTEMVESLSTPYPLRLLSGKQRRWAKARNAGVEAAEGRVCLHVDDDIVCGARMLAGHVAAHEEGERILAIGKLVQAPPDADDWYAHAFAQGLNEHYEELAASASGLDRLLRRQPLDHPRRLPRGRRLRDRPDRRDRPRVRLPPDRGRLHPALPARRRRHPRRPEALPAHARRRQGRRPRPPAGRRQAPQHRIADAGLGRPGGAGRAGDPQGPDRDQIPPPHSPPSDGCCRAAAGR